MKRLIWTVVLLAFYMSVCVAQTIAEYTFSTTTDGTLQDMTGSTNFTGFNPGTYYDDTAFGITNIGFSFSLGASSYTQFSINSNGQMQLGSTAISGGQASPAANTARIAPLSGDNCIRTTGKVHYLLTGSAPNRKLTVEWLDLRIPYGNSAESGTYCRMQVWLYEGSNNIKFVYGTMWNMATSATSRGVYISTSNVSGTIGMVYNITSTPTWANTGSSVTNTSFNASSAMLNLDSSTDGSRRVFHINYPVYTTPPNPAVLLSPTNNGFAFNGDALTWQSGGGAPTGYDVYFGTSAYPGLVSNNQQSNSYTPTLVAGTTYFWKVVAHNQYGYANESATWSFKVPNGTQLVESFESTTFPPTGWANPGTWSRITSSYKYGTASAYKYGSSSAQYILSTPKLTITPTSIFSIWTMCSSTTGTLQIVYSPDRTTWTQIGSNITHAVTGSWYNTLVDLGSLAGNNYYLGIRTGLQSTSFYVDMCVGPELAPEVPGVPILSTPADFATNVLENTTFTWTAPSTGGVPSGYRVYCDTDNPPTTQIADVNALTFTPITPLEYNTLHYWTVMAYNGEGNGVSATVRSFTTRANPTISSFPTVWDFGTLTADPFPPTNWTKHSGVLASPSVLGAPGTGNWIQDDWKNITTPANKAARINIYSTYNGWLISPPIAVPGNDYEVRFDVAYMAYGNNNAPGLTGTDDQFAVMIGDGTSWTSANVVRKWDNAGSPHVLNEIPPAGISVSLPLGTAGTKYVAFYGISTASNADNDLMVDNIEVRQTPAAPIFSYSPNSIDFGSIANGQQIGPQSLTITNNGGGTLYLAIGDISLTGPDASEFSFSTDNLPAALGAGQSATIPVYVTGTAEGAISATLRIVYNSTNYDVSLSATVLPEGLVAIGSGAVNSNIPIHPYYGYTYSQSLFLQSEINTSNKRINKISYYWNGALEGVNSNDWTIYMGHTTKTAFASTTDWIPSSSLSQVFAGNVALPATPGWIEITLDSPFVYNNSDNLVIAVDENETGYEANTTAFFYCTASASHRSLRYYSDTTNPNPGALPSGTLVLGYPNVHLYFGNLPSDPLPAINPSPSNLATNVSLHPVFSWQANPNPSNPAPTGYKFSLWDSNGYYVENQDLIHATSYEHPNELTFNTAYSWKVVPYTTEDAENCPTWTFTTTSALPPQNLVANATGDHVMLHWSAPNYRGQVPESNSRSPQPTRQTILGYNVFRNTVQINTELVSDTGYYDFAVSHGVTYTYYVQAVYAAGVSEASNVVTLLFKCFPEINVSVNQMLFSPIFVGETQTQTFLVTNTGSGLLQVTDIEIAHSDFTITPTQFQLGILDSLTVHVTIACSSINNITNMPLTIHSNAYMDNLHVISISREVYYPPVIDLSTTEINKVLVGNEPQMESLTISNLGEWPLEFNFGPVPNWFSINPTSGINYQEIVITFYPAQMDSLQETYDLVVYSNDLVNPSVLIHITATKQMLFYTTNDNENNANTGIADNDMDVALNGSSPLLPVEFNLLSDAGPFYEAKLIILANGVDEASGYVHNVSFNGHNLGRLRGNATDWCSTVFTVDPAWIIPNANNLVQVFVDPLLADPTLVIDRGQMQINGQTREAFIRTANVPQPLFPGATASVQLELDSSLSSQSVNIETLLYSPGGILLARDSRSRTLNAQANDPFTVNLTIPPSGYPGVYEVKVLVFSGTLGLLQDLELIPVQVNPYQSAIAYNPTSLNFGQVLTEVTSSLPVTIQNTGLAPLQITQLNIDNPVFSIAESSLSIPAGGSYQLSVSYLPLSAGTQSGTLSLSCNDPINPYPQIALSGEGIPNIPYLNVSTNELAFGEVFTVVPQTLGITIGNTGPAELFVWDITSSDPAFSAVPTYFSLAQNQSREVFITFSPTTAGEYSAQLTLSNNSANLPSYVINVSGTGAIAPEIAISPLGITQEGFTGNVYTLPASITNTGGGSLNWQVVDHFGKALKTRGHTVAQSDYAVIPNQQQNQLYGGNWTVSAWFRVESNLGFPGNGGKQYILSKASETANGFFGIYTSGIAGGSEGKAIALQMRYNSQNYSLVKNNLLSLNTWYHVAVSYSDGTARLYLNGAELGTLAVPGYNGDPTAWALGKLSPTTSTTYRFCGGIDEFRVYNQSLSASQIKQSMFSRLGGTETGLTGYWNMDSGSVTDLTPYLDHGTLYGGATIIPSTVSEIPAWLGFSQTYGSTQNGTPDEFNVVLNTNEMIGGQYSATMQVRSNDPIHSIVQIPVSLSLTGYALISLSRENIDFGNVFVNETANQQLTIYNNGTDVLNISSISSSDPAFVPTQSSLIIAAGASANLGIAFHPSLATDYSGQLSIQTSVPGFETMTVNLSGNGALHPLISINPTSFSSTLAFGTEETQQLKISNLQGIPLEYSLSLQETGSRDLLNGDLDGFPANIRGMVFIGNLMYLVDYANARLLTYDPQTQTIIQQLPIHANPWGICYDGTNLWIGSQSGTFREYNFAGELLRSFSYPLATNPSISYNGSEFLIGKSFDLNPQIYRVSVQGVTLGTLSTAGLNGRLSQTTWVPWHSDGQLWAVDSGAKKLRQFSIQGSQLVQLQSINCNFQESASIAHNGKDLYVGENQAGHLFRVDDGITEFNWISVNPESSEVVSGQSENVNLNFQARTRFAGNYTANLTVSSNDPLHPQQIVPLSLTVTGQPSLHLHTTIIPHGHVFSNQSDTRSLIIANLGTANLNVTLSAPVPYSVDVSSFTLAPLSSRTVYVTFSPTVVGSYPASLTITTNDPTNPVATVTLEGECVNPPIASVSPISITTALTNTANEEIHTLTLSNTGGYSMLYDILMEELEAGDKLGSTLATYPSFPDSSMGMVWANSHLYVVNNSQAKLMEYDPATHSIVNAWGIHSRPCGITWDGQAFWIGDQSGYLYKYLPADLLAVGSIPAASFKSPINGIPSVCWTGTDFLLNNSWVESGNTTFYRVNTSGQTLATYSSNAGTYIAQTAWVNQYQGDQLWAFQNVKEGDQFVSGKILKLSISGASISKTQEKEFHDNLIGFSFTGDGKDLWYSDGNGPLYKLDDGRWLSASPVKGNVALGTNLPIAITVNPRLRNGGTYHANLLVNTNDPAHQQLSVPVILNLTGIPEISVNPSQLAFPNTYTGESSQLQLAITNNGTDILSISSITCPLAVYSVPQQTWTIGIGATQFVTVSFNPLVAGAHNAILTINSNAGENPALQVPLTGSGVLRTATIGVASNLVNFGNSIIGNPVHRDLMISNTGSGPLNITSFVFSSPVFSTLEQTMNIASGNEAGLRLFFSPAQAIAYNGTLTIYSNDPNQPEKIVMLSGLGELGQISIAIDPLYYNFGTVSVGSSQAYNFTIGSQGNSPLIISQITSSSPVFSLPQLPIVVAPGTTSNLEIVFCPTTNQLVSGTLSITSNDPLNPVKTIIVEGTGEYVPILSYDPGSFDRYIVAETNETQYLTIGNSGTAVLNYNLTLSGNPVWLSLSQTAGSITPGANVQIGVIINTATVPAGTYQSAVVITCNDLTQPQKTIPVTLVHSDYNFTTLDNDNNAHAGVPDGDLDVNINEYSAIHPIEFNIWTDQLNPADAILRIRAYNITANELSEVRINHQLVGTLCSSPSAWGISQFRIPAALLNFGNNVANGIQIDLDTTHQNPGSSRLDWGQLLFTTDGLFANIRYFYVDSSNHYPGSNVHAVLENDTQLYTQNVRSEIKLLSPVGADVAVNNLQGTISYGNSEPQGTGFTIPVGSQAGTWTLTMNLYDADSSILQESRSTTFEVGSYLPQLSLLSSSVDFGSVFSGQTQVRNLVVRNIGQAPLYVTELQINDPAFSVATSGFTLNYNQSQTIPITFSPTGSGSYNATLSMISNDAGSPSLVPLTGLGVNPPQIALSEYSVTKLLYMSQTGTEQLRIYNQGDSPLMISSITRVYQTGSGWLTFNPSSATINPGIDIGLNLNFNTGTLGTGIYDATLSITSNDPVNGYLVIPITLQVSNRPTANFTALPLSGNAPLTVQFTDTSTPLPGTTLSTWLWDFANNGVHTSNLQNPQWTYTTPGTYSVKLTVTTNTGLNGSTTKTGYITVLNNPPVLTNPGQQLSINMLENTSNSSLNLYSVFSDPDGDPLTFTHTPVQNVGISISNGVVTITPAQYWSGLATLTFTARDNHGGQLSTTVQLTVNHINNPPQFDLPQSLSFLKNTGYTVDFAPYVFDPDVEDSGLTLGITGGSNISYSINGRMVTFSAIPNWTGTETLFFTVSDGITEPAQGSIPITVLNGFNADFFADNLEPLAGITVQFTDTTPGNPNYWAWEFDYGVRIINSFEQNPTYTYSFGGFKSVKLTVAYWDGQVYQGLSSVIKSNYINVRGTLISGAVSGFWPLAGSPFVVSENIFIPAGNNLEIQEDVSVVFLEDLPFQINGSMVADGVSFGTTEEGGTRQTPVWKGLYFNPGSAGSNLQNISIKDAETPISINGAQLSLAHINITKSDSLSLPLETGVKIENSSLSMNDLEISNYSKGIKVINTLQTRTPITPSLTNIRIRNTSSSVRPDAIGIELTGFVEADIDQLDLQDFGTGIKYIGTGELAGTNPSLTNIRIRNTSSSVRTEGTAIYVKDVPVFSIINNPALPDSILDYKKGIVVETETAASSNPSISNIRIRNTSSSVRTDATAIELSGNVSGTYSNLDLTDYFIGLSATNETTAYSTPSLTNIRIRNTSSSVRPLSSAIVLSGKVSSSMNNLTIDEYDNGIVMDGDGTFQTGSTPSITNIRIRSTSSSVRSMGTAISVTDVPFINIINSPTAADSIVGYNTGIAIQTTLGTTSNASISNVRIRNTSSSVRTDDTAIELTGKVVPNFTNLDLDDYSTGISHVGDGTYQAGQTPSLTNIRIRNTSSSVREGLTGLYIKDVPYYSVTGDSICGFTTGVSIVNEQQAVSAPSLTNVHIRNTSSSVRPALAGVSVTGLAAVNFNNLEVIDYSLGISLTGTGQETSTQNPSLTNVRIRNTSSSVRVGSKGIELKNLAFATLDDETIEGYIYGVWIENTLPTISAPEIKNSTLRFADSTLYPDATGIYSLGKVQGSVHHNLVDGYSLGTSLFGQNATAYTNNQYLNCHTGFRVEGASANPNLSYNVLRKSGVAALPLLSAFSLVNTTSLTVRNNTIYGYQSGISALAAGCDFTQNIVWAAQPIANPINAVTSMVNVNYNNIYDASGTTAGTANMNAQPAFINELDGDYHLSLYSPCIDAGDPTLPRDPDGSIADLGCFYYAHGASFSVAPPSGSVINEPVQFTSSSVGHDPNTAIYQWSFVDPLQIDSYAANPTHTYTHAGAYDITLTMQTGFFSDTVTFNGYTVWDTAPLPVPQTVQAVADLDQITLSWDSGKLTAVFTGAKSERATALGYRIYRKAPSAVDFSLLTQLPLTQSSYLDQALTPGLWSYYVVSFDAETESTNSGIATAEVAYQLYAPRSLKAYHSNGKARLTWLPPLENSKALNFILRNRLSRAITLQSYELYRDNQLLIILPSTQTSYLDEGVTVGTAYRYYLVAIYNYGASQGSNSVSITPLENTSSTTMNYNSGDGSYSATLDPQGDGNFVDIVIIPSNPIAGEISIIYSTNPSIINGLSNPDALGAYFAFEGENPNAFTGLVTFRVRLPYQTNDIWYRSGASWNLLNQDSWILLSPPAPDFSYEITINFDRKGKAGKVEIASDKGGDSTLPIHLSSFTATLGSGLAVSLKWTVESETDHLGYNVLRSDTDQMIDAIQINSSLIDQGTSNGTAITYVYSDQEVEDNHIYYYWLESLTLSGVASYAGPISVTIGDPGTPEIPVPGFATHLMDAFPNPFNPNTNIRYAITEPGDVHISIYNLKGQLLHSYQNSYPEKGYYQVSWDGRDDHGNIMGSGVYLYKMQFGRYSSSKKMILMK